MMPNKLSKRQDKALHKALASVVLTQFPNPERTDCPGAEVLRAIATKTISMRDPAIEHVGQCSPCFAELTQMRQALHRRKVVSATGTGATVIILAILVTYFSFRRVESQHQTSQTSVETGIANQIGGVAQRGASVPPAPSPEPRYETALLDLRNASATRTVEPSISRSNVQPIEIPRGPLALTVQLPIGSDVGAYEVQIRKPNQPALRAAKGKATIENGITKLPVSLDTSSIQPGEYEFAWRLDDFSWRHHPILIR
jgi:hypothetical protein